MAFNAPQKGLKKPGLDPKADAMERQRQLRSNADAADQTIEGNLKRVLDGQVTDAPKESADEDKFKQEVDAPLVRLVNSVISEAVRRTASDIHIEPFENLLRVRFRIDGVLQEIQKIPHKLASAIVSRLKIMADLDICEKRIPQDGTIKFRHGTVEADLRMSSLPSAFGEKICMRVMGRTNVNNDLSKLGIPDQQLRILRDAVNKPDGLVLVTGPTGSGKTTTLYAALNELNDISVSVFTAEDPVEGTIHGVTQCQVNAAVGYTFASVLRAFLRQDPDVILVGEIRDQETAEISIKAALTGHLVLSTLHTNCSVSTISRLMNMGVQPYLLTSSINCIVAQRLVRRICPDCKQSRQIPPEMLEKLGSAAQHLESDMMWFGTGCDNCHSSGYKGRAPVYEVLTLSDELRRMILAGASKDELKARARIDGLITLRQAGLNLVKEGITTFEEVMGATNEDSDINPQALAQVSPITQVYEVNSAVAPMAAMPRVEGAGNGGHSVKPEDPPTEFSQAREMGEEGGAATDSGASVAAKWKRVKPNSGSVVSD